MPVQYFRRATSAPTMPGGTQYISGGTLNITGYTTITLDSSVYTAAGKYTLFDYANGSYSGDQSNLNYITLDDSQLTGLTVKFGSLTWDPDAKRITFILN